MFFAEIHCFHGPLVKISPTAYRSTGWLCLYKDCSVIDVCARACSFPCCWLRVCVGNVWFGERSEVLNRESVNIWKEVCIVEMGGGGDLEFNRKSPFLTCVSQMFAFLTY